MVEGNKTSDYKRVVEAALFVSGKAMDANEIAKVLGIASVGYVKRLMDELISDYKQRDGSLMISRIGDKYALGIKDAYIERVNSLAGAPEISRGALRTLAYISKNEPIMQNSIVRAFGSSTYEYVKELTEKEFVRSTRAGRTKKIETTPKFREYFNI